MRPHKLTAAALLIAAITLAARGAQESLPSSAFLQALPDGEMKQRFMLDCTGCHTFREDKPYPGGQPRTREAWVAAMTRMVGNFGPNSGFPVIGPHRDIDATADWLSRSLPPASAIEWTWPTQLERKADMREYLLPNAGDLPHDVAISDGKVIVTGMFSAQMYVVDPESGAVTTERTPEPNPRAVEVDGNGDWWIVLGAPKKVAQRTGSGTWQTYDAGFYAHSVALAPDGGVWVNGHFTHEPELLRRIDPKTGAHRDYEVPRHPAFQTTPVPYEIRAAPNGDIWMSELQGNRLVRVDVKNNIVKTWDMPTPWSGPRRLDVDDDGNVWIPEYAANKLARFDAKAATFTEYTLPLPDAAPYVVRYDARRKLVWIGTGAADALIAFEPATQKFTYYRLPSKDQMIRHLAIDPATGDLWLAPGSSPGTVSARIVRVRPHVPYLHSPARAPRTSKELDTARSPF